MKHTTWFSGMCNSDGLTFSSSFFRNSWVREKVGRAWIPQHTLLASCFLVDSSTRSCLVGGPLIVPCSTVSRSISLSSFMLWENLWQAERKVERMEYTKCKCIRLQQKFSYSRAGVPNPGYSSLPGCGLFVTAGLACARVQLDSREWWTGVHA